MAILRVHALALLLLGSVHLACSRRLSYSLAQPVPVDFNFMTKDKNYTGRTKSAFGAMTQWLWADRADGNTKEEIVRGHRCQKHGGVREHTYYAASFCYWIPEIFDTWTRPLQPLLNWQGGQYTSGSPLIDGTEIEKGGLEGTCVKASTCHNNGQEDDGTVTRGKFMLEHVTLPDGCLGEKEILQQCAAGLQEANADLKQKVVSCASTEDRYTTAVKGLNACLTMLKELPEKIGRSIPWQISDTQSWIRKMKFEVSSARSRVTSVEGDVYYKCSGFSTFVSPFCPATDSFNDPQKYRECKRCQGAHRSVKAAKEAVRRAQGEQNRAEAELRSLESQLAQASKDLKTCQDRTPNPQLKKTAKYNYMGDKCKCKGDHNGSARVLSCNGNPWSFGADG